MPNQSPCDCGHDHEEEKDAPLDGQATSDNHECCGGSCHAENSTGKDHLCGCGHEHAPTITPEEMEKLKAAITEAGYTIEETPDGDIKILDK